MGAVGVLALVLTIPTFVWGMSILESRAARKQRALPQPVNVVNGVVLPEPDDPRWSPVGCPHQECKRSNLHRFVLGSVVVKDDCEAYYAGVQVASVSLRYFPNQQTDPYYTAVRLAFCSRKAQESIEGVPELQQLALPAVR